MVHVRLVRNEQSSREPRRPNLDRAYDRIEISHFGSIYASYPWLEERRGKTRQWCRVRVDTVDSLFRSNTN
jgi:hypothetical protein